MIMLSAISFSDGGVRFLTSAIWHIVSVGDYTRTH